MGTFVIVPIGTVFWCLSIPRCTVRFDSVRTIPEGAGQIIDLKINFSTYVGNQVEFFNEVHHPGWSNERVGPPGHAPLHFWSQVSKGGGKLNSGMLVPKSLKWFIKPGETLHFARSAVIPICEYQESIKLEQTVSITRHLFLTVRAKEQ